MNAGKQDRQGPEALCVGDWIYFPDLLKLQRDKEEVKLEPLVGHLLWFLAQRAGRPVSREELLGAIWPDRIVGDEALSSAINKLRRAFSDDRKSPCYLETIPKVGYRLIATVRRPELIPGEAGRLERSAKEQVNGARHRNQLTVFASVGLLLAIMLTVFLPWSSDRPFVQESAGGKPPAVVVKAPRLLILPFINLSDDAKQQYLADGIVEDLITDLSRIETIRVLARSTSFQYKKKHVDPKQLATELGVSHLIEGSVRRSGEALHITARLIEAGTAQNLWSQRYDQAMAGSFVVQEDLVRSIAQALSVDQHGGEIERIGSRPANSFEVYDMYLKGREILSHRTPEANRQAQDYYRQAILLDPEFSRAYGGIAAALTRYANKGWSETPNVERDLALQYATKAVELDPESPFAYWSLGFTHLYRHENLQAADAIRKALQLAPGYADGMSLLAQIQNYSGNPEEAIELINDAIIINPLYSWDYLFNLGWAHYTLGDYQQAVKYLTLALQRNQYATYARLVLAASHVALNQPGEAQWQVDEILSYHTNMSISFLKQETPIDLSSQRIQKYLSDLRTAGIPEE